MTCCVVAPEIFEEVPEHSGGLGTSFTRVARDPQNANEHQAVRQAMFLCPGKAISVVRPAKIKEKTLKIFDGFPRLLDDDVYYVGFDSAGTFGASSYFIRREDGQNMLIDPPAVDAELLQRLHELGGIKYLLFTHKDHTANQEAWFKATHATRVIHESDVHWKKDFSPFPVTADFEVKLRMAPLEVQTLEDCPELTIVSIPGHTAGSVFFLYKQKFLFTGDSLGYSPAREHLWAFRLQCWQDWQLQRRSLAHLRTLGGFTWVLPGHGIQHRFASAAEADESLQKCLSWMDTQASGNTNIIWYILFKAMRMSAKNNYELKNRFKLWIADNLVLPAGAKRVIPTAVMPSWQLYGLLLLPLLAPAMLICSTNRLSILCQPYATLCK